MSNMDQEIEFCEVCGNPIVFEGPILINGLEVHEYDICVICQAHICKDCGKPLNINSSQIVCKSHTQKECDEYQ